MQMTQTQQHPAHGAPCTVLTETSACDMSLAEHQASSEVLQTASATTLSTLLAALPLLLAVVFVAFGTAWGNSSGSTWPPPSSPWRMNLHKLFDPLQRLLRSGTIASREYEHA
jgi:hypothetical protein